MKVQRGLEKIRLEGRDVDLWCGSQRGIPSKEDMLGSSVLPEQAVTAGTVR